MNIINKNQKIIFDDEGNEIKVPITNIAAAYDGPSETIKEHVKGNKFPKLIHDSQMNNDDIDTKWYYAFEKYNSISEYTELKDVEIQELRRICKHNYNNELLRFQKTNPSDAKWLFTALDKGTSKDRANAGALIVQTNPLANLMALEKLIALSKISNKSSIEAVDIITELFINSLLPPNRKLLSIQLRGTDWKKIKKLSLDKSELDKVFAYWHFEDELKEHYFEFLKNLQFAIQSHQDGSKNQAIVYSGKLLCYAPEKEQMLLSMLVNKLGDPSSKVASKALHHLSEVAYKHPNMCEVITIETEKLLFRNNISEHAQHFALCFLGQIAPRGNANVCTKLVQICFSYFKIVVNRGAVNSRTMQAILRCLKRVIVDAACCTGTSNNNVNTSGSVLTKDIEDTLYRLIHLANIQIALQTFTLLLEIMTIKNDDYNRYYNALYKKMFDMNSINGGNQIAAQFLHILHRSIHRDRNVKRCQAFIKRLLQMSLYFPVHICCGCLIIVNKLLKTRPELWKFDDILTCTERNDTQIMLDESHLQNKNIDDKPEEDDDDLEYYHDVAEDDGDAFITEVIDKKSNELNSKPKIQSWYHAKNVQSKVIHIDTAVKINNNNNNSEMKKYNLFHRVPAYAGAEFMPYIELFMLTKHFHPTIQLFAKTIIENRYIQFYGDPLRDFSLAHFLERFSFKNPKKWEHLKNDLSFNDMATTAAAAAVQSVHITNKSVYTSYGSRGVPVNNLTASNCTEDEHFIFEYLNMKRLKRAQFKTKHDDDDDHESIGSVDDDEFDAYLDGLTKTNSKKYKDMCHLNDVEEIDRGENIDFMKELGNDLQEEAMLELQSNGNKIKHDNKRKSKEIEEETENDWEFNDDDDYDDDEDNHGSISFDDDGDDDDPEIFDGSDDDDNNNSIAGSPPKKTKKTIQKAMSAKQFTNKLKHTDDLNSLFAAAEDFSEMLEETGKSKNHGTLGEVFNKDKSSDIQMKWESTRMKLSDSSSRGTRRFGGYNRAGGRGIGRSINKRGAFGDDGAGAGGGKYQGGAKHKHVSHDGYKKKYN